MFEWIKKILTKIKDWIMANYATLKAAIEDVIKTNGNKEITGSILQQALKAIIDSLGANYQLVGFATPGSDGTNPGTPDQNVAYIAGAGEYPNFGGTTVEKNQIGVFKYNGSWDYSVVNCGVYLEYEESPDDWVHEWTFYDGINEFGYTICVQKNVSALGNSPKEAISAWWASRVNLSVKGYDEEIKLQIQQGIAIDSKNNLLNNVNLLSGSKVRFRFDNAKNLISGSFLKITDSSWRVYNIPIENEYATITLTQDTTSLGFYLESGNAAHDGILSIALKTDFVDDDISKIEERVSINEHNIREHTTDIEDLDIDVDKIRENFAVKIPKNFSNLEQFNVAFDEFYCIDESFDLSNIVYLTFNVGTLVTDTNKYKTRCYVWDNNNPLTVIPERDFDTREEAIDYYLEYVEKIIYIRRSPTTYIFKCILNKRPAVFWPSIAKSSIELNGDTCTSEELNPICSSTTNNSDIRIFNDLVEDFVCTPYFNQLFKNVDIRFAQTRTVGYYSSFIFYAPGWYPSIVLLDKDGIATLNDAVNEFKSLQGKEFVTSHYRIKFKKEFPDNYIGITFGGAITYTNIAHNEYYLDFLPKMTIAQDNADNYLRNEIINQKIKEAILNPEAASVILDYNINDEMAKKTFQMVRTDEVVLNDNLALYSSNDAGIKAFEGAASGVGRKYFCTHELSSDVNVWNFLDIKTSIQESITQNKRFIPRMFTACGVPHEPLLTFEHINSKTGEFERNRINFPLWIAEIMAEDENAQWLTYAPAEQSSMQYPKYWLLDYNVAGVREAIIGGIRAFGDFLANETVVNPYNVNIPIKDAILYIEFNPLGSWGEGQMSPLSFNCAVDDMLELWEEFMLAAPDNIITTGGLITDSEKGIELTDKIHNISNNVCKYGFTIEHLGAIDESVDKGLYNKYAGNVFISGEGAGWYKTPYWGGNCYLNMLQYLKRVCLSYARIENWTIEDADLNPLKNFPDTAFKNKQMMAFIGYRFVLTPTYTEWRDNGNTLRIYIAICNIGCSKCWFNFYEFHAILTDSEEQIISDVVKSGIDLTKILPRDDLGTYSLGNEYDLNTYVDVDVSSIAKTAESTSNFNVYVRVEDKFGIRQPLYFSNYGRKKNGTLTGAYKIGGYNAQERITIAGLYEKEKIRPGQS